MTRGAAGWLAHLAATLFPETKLPTPGSFHPWIIWNQPIARQNCRRSAVLL
jgi:hypothetical protein